MRGWLATHAGENVLVIVTGASNSPEMVRAGDELHPVVIARGDASDLLAQTGAMGTLTSDSTHRVGLVSGCDIIATFRSAGGLAPEGNAIRVVPGEPPFALHAKYLHERRMYVPVAIVAGSAVFLLLVFALFAFYQRARLPRWALLFGRWACFATPALSVALLAAGHLPTLSYFWVAVLAAVVTILLPAAALAWSGRGVLAPPLALGLMILGLFALEAATGWYGTMFTLLGGTALDGARFYGLPNAFEGLLIGSAVYIAANLKPKKGFAVIIAVALFVGLPGLGADLGGAIATLAAAGIWLGLSTRDRFSWREGAKALTTIVVGMGVILLAHRFLTTSPTHGTAFVETSTHDPLHVISVLWERLGIGVRLLRRNPIGITYLAATPLLIWMVTKGRGGFNDSFQRFPQWRSAMLTILWASVVGYFVNDTGVSAVGMGFAMALGGVLYVPLAREAVNMDGR